MINFFKRKEKKSWVEELKECFTINDNEKPFLAIYGFMFYHEINDNVVRIRYRNVDK